MSSLRTLCQVPGARCHVMECAHWAPGWRRLLLILGTWHLALGTCLLTGCTRGKGLEFQAISMWNGSRLKPLEASPMPDQASSSRSLVPGTVARGELPADDPVNTGMSGKALLTTFPVAVTRETLERGQARFEIYCSPCHGRLGNGEGAIVQRGFPHPPDYKIQRLVNAPVGHFFDVMTHGYGVMYSYASRVPPNDRWAIAAYLRVLQKVNRPVIPEAKFRLERLRGRETGIGTRPAPETNVPITSPPETAEPGMHREGR
jgi:mono/diheme cytochrome c family protein